MANDDGVRVAEGGGGGWLACNEANAGAHNNNCNNKL